MTSAQLSLFAVEQSRQATIRIRPTYQVRAPETFDGDDRWFSPAVLHPPASSRLAAWIHPRWRAAVCGLEVAS